MSKRHKHSKWMYKIVIPSLSICAFAVVICGVKRIDDYQTDKRESYIAENARMVIWYIRFQQKVLLVPITWMQ